MSEETLQQLKNDLRRQAYARRRAHPDKDTSSRRILERLQQLPQFQAAETVMFYVHARSEVRTQFALPALRVTTAISSCPTATVTNWACSI